MKKLLVLIVLLSSVSMPAMARQVSTAPEAKKCELGGNKIGKTYATTSTVKSTNSTTRAN
jgi:hypothetical protein